MKKNTIKRALATAAALLLGLTAGGGTTLTVKAEDTPTVTIHPGSNDKGIHKYTYYKIFDATKSTGEAGNTTGTSDGTLNNANGLVAQTIKSDSAWFSVLFDSNGTAKSGQIWVTATKQGSTDVYTIQPTTSESGKSALQNAEQAKVFAEWLNQNKGDISGTVFNNSSAGGNATANLTPGQGYYLITSSLGNQLILATSDINVYEKNEYPDATKMQSISNDGTGFTSEDINREIGQNVSYKIDVTIPASAKDANNTIEVSDIATKGLTLNTAITWSAKTNETLITDPTTSVTGWSSLPLTWSKATNYTATDNESKYTVEIPASVVSSLADKANDSTTVTLTLAYTATVNADAVIYDENNLTNNNTATITYDNFTTQESTVKTRVFDFKLTKTFAGSTSADSSYKATFELRTDAGDTNTAKKFTSNENTYTVATSEQASKDITAIKDAQITISGLAQGTYYLVETNTQAGYNTLANPITVAVDKDGKVTFTNPNSNAEITNNGAIHGAIIVENLQGSVLPSTGGIGTTIFYIAGIALVIGAAVVLVNRKHKENA